MRRIAATTLTVGTMVAALAATAAPAQAATSWATTSTNGGFKNVKASGVYSRTASKVAVKFRLSDMAKDGNAACVQFRFTEGNSIHTQKFWLYTVVKGKKVLLDRKATVTGGNTTDANTTHLSVRECAISTKSKKTYYAAWKNLF